VFNVQVRSRYGRGERKLEALAAKRKRNPAPRRKREAKERWLRRASVTCAGFGLFPHVRVAAQAPLVQVCWGFQVVSRGGFPAGTHTLLVALGGHWAAWWIALVARFPLWLPLNLASGGSHQCPDHSGHLIGVRRAPHLQCVQDESKGSKQRSPGHAGAHSDTGQPQSTHTLAVSWTLSLKLRVPCALRAEPAAKPSLSSSKRPTTPLHSADVQMPKRPELGVVGKTATSAFFAFTCFQDMRF